MSKSYKGGCACGALRYEMRSEPVFQNHCQCLDCQKRSGTGHGSYLTFPEPADTTVTGEAKTWRITADSGNDKLYAFCPTCGTPVYVSFVAAPNMTAIQAASLDEPSRYRPHAITYAGRALDWDTLDPSLQRFDKMPG